MNIFLRLSFQSFLLAGVAGSLACTETAPTAEEACDELASSLDACWAATHDIPPGHEKAFRSTCLANLSEPGVTATPADLMALAQQIRGTERGCNAPSLPSPRGTLPPGETCVTSIQCASGACTLSFSEDKTDFPVCGVCAPLLGKGAECDGTTVCDTGLVCRNGLCSAPAARGDRCAGSWDCAPGLRCKSHQCVVEERVAVEACTTPSDCSWSPARCVDGKCTAAAGLGEGCVTSDDCKLGLWCDSGGCVRPPKAIPPGAPCDVVAGDTCERGVCANGVCPSALTRGEACSAILSDGVDATTRFCEDGTSCIRGRCQVASTEACR